MSEFKDWAVLFALTQLMVSGMFLAVRLSDGMPFYEALGKFAFAWSLGFILCMLALFIGTAIFEVFNKK